MRLLAAVCLLLLLPITAVGQDGPMLGATLTPSTLSLENRSASTRIQNLGNIPVTIAGDATLSPGLAATGYRVIVDPPTLEPEQWATVTLRQRKRTPPSDLTLDIRMSPGQAQSGMDTTTLRFPIPVDHPRATPATTAHAWIRAILAEWWYRLDEML